jgi:NAD(P)-dependent dehydrogenase (short-subunit alcohol dehydrogenase family)
VPIATPTSRAISSSGASRPLRRTTIAIYGAGPALGLAVARRFGREGFGVALVARSRERLDGMTRELAADGVEAAGFPADLADRDAALRAADQIEARFGAIDVLEYSPTPARLLTSPLEVDVATVAPLPDAELRAERDGRVRRSAADRRDYREQPGAPQRDRPGFRRAARGRGAGWGPRRSPI